MFKATISYHQITLTYRHQHLHRSKNQNRTPMSMDIILHEAFSSPLTPL